MSNYHTLRTQGLFTKPVANPNLGSTTNSFGNVYLTEKIYVNNAEVDLNKLLVPRISSITFTQGRSTANVSGYETLTVNGTGFSTGARVLIDKREADTTTYVNSTQLTFTTPQKPAGTYSFFVVNSDGSTGSNSTGITYS